MGNKKEKLKTLEDIPEYDIEDYDLMVDKDDLRQELGIKRIKVLRKKVKNSDTRGSVLTKLIIAGEKGQIEVLMEIFNIAEDELKERQLPHPKG